MKWLWLLVLFGSLLTLAQSKAGTEITGPSGGYPGTYITGVFSNNAPAPPTGAIVQTDGTSLILQTDNSSSICLAGESC